MKITYYKTLDSANTINKTIEPVLTENIYVPFTEPPLMFKLYLANNDLYLTINYSQLDGKFYFVNFEQMNPKIVSASFSLDVLETYKDRILESDFDISEKSTIDFNSNVPTSSEIENKVIKSNVTIQENKSIIVTTTGEVLS
jgi:hypothetical protein